MNHLDRLSFIIQIATNHPSIGKTAMMKCLYLLQEVEKIPLEYSFELYTYGPYSSSVMEEIEYASSSELLDITTVLYPTGYYGYEIKCSSRGQTYLDNKGTINQYQNNIKSITDTFGGKQARELELLTTIIFILIAFKENGSQISKISVCNSVAKAKPHLSLDDILNGYTFLDTNGYLGKALS